MKWATVKKKKNNNNKVEEWEELPSHDFFLILIGIGWEVPGILLYHFKEEPTIDYVYSLIADKAYGWWPNFRRYQMIELFLQPCTTSSYTNT